MPTWTTYPPPPSILWANTPSDSVLGHVSVCRHPHALASPTTPLPPTRKMSQQCLDASLLEMEFAWPKTPLSAPIRKLSNKLDSALLALTGPEWRNALKENSLRANIRSCDEAKKSVLKSEFQSLIEKATLLCTEFESLVTFAMAHKALQKTPPWTTTSPPPGL